MLSRVSGSLVLIALVLITSLLVSEIRVLNSTTERQKTATMSATSFKYPNSLQRGDLTSVRDFHGREMVDKYAWLEDPNSEDVKKWVEEQNGLTRGHIDQLDFKEKLKNRYASQWLCYITFQQKRALFHLSRWQRTSGCHFQSFVCVFLAIEKVDFFSPSNPRLPSHALSTNPLKSHLSSQCLYFFPNF